jgi:tRNA threonylcarbamoyladenosine biosynthesis protein TsaE
MTPFTLITDSPEQTIAFGHFLGERMKGGEVLAIDGTLGTGKTHLIKGIAAGVGANQMDQVNSPTFVLVNEYRGRLDMYHIDAYRLASLQDFEMLGFDDFLYPGAIVLIEWADKVKGVLQDMDTINLHLCHVSDTKRSIAIENAPYYLNLTDFEGACGVQF